MAPVPALDAARLPFQMVFIPLTSDSPVVLDWVIPDDNCTYAIKNRTSYACGDNTDCSDSSNPNGGYNCHCTHVCTNTVGSYNCSCPKGTHGDGFKGGSGTGCIKNQSRVIEIALGNINYIFQFHL
uniref:Wall-associated receptor kinase 2-like n=1 Tax=Nelumbo nucifera TaxID=4432 RepID=A0A822Z7W4_NELNU|nr:TPA_asm: hypothetical protein HUJ06_014094 [Nelumbo nucifera]